MEIGGVGSVPKDLGQEQIRRAYFGMDRAA